MMERFVDGPITEEDMQVLFECAGKISFDNQLIFGGARDSNKITLGQYRDMVELKYPLQYVSY